MKIVMVNDCAFVGETLIKYLPRDFKVFEENLRDCVKRLIYTFSYAIYGESINVPIDGNHPTKTLFLYDLSKLQSSITVEFFMKFRGLKQSVHVSSIFMDLGKVADPSLSTDTYVQGSINTMGQ